MKKLFVFVAVFVLFGGTAANLLGSIFKGASEQKRTIDCEDDDPAEGYFFNRRVTLTSPGSDWRTPVSTERSFVGRAPSVIEDIAEYHRNRYRDRERGSSTTESSRTTKEGQQDRRWTMFAKDREAFVPIYTTGKYPISKGDSQNSQSKGVSPDSNEGGGRMRLAEKWCSRYKNKCKSRPSLGNGISTRIVGGSPAKPKQHPHMAMIGYEQEGAKQWLCGGSLISSRFILSAAHCSRTLKWGPAKWARLGDLDISSTTEDSQPQEREIVERIVHPNYKDPAVYNDIALFKLDRDVAFTPWVHPACLHLNRNTEPGAVVTGWGRLDFISDTSPKLLEVNVEVFDDFYCNVTINRTAGSRMPKGYDAKTMVCAGDRAGGKDACQGDSGGPLIIAEESCTKTQIGITSTGNECGLPDSPGVYTRVSEYVSWIENIVWN